MVKGSDRIGRAGEHYVAAELNRRGAYASPFSGNVPGIDIVATDDTKKRMAYIQVKTRQRGVIWHMNLRHGWDVPNPRPPCLCVGTCERGECKSDHEHHLEARDLHTLPKILGEPDHYWVFVSLNKDLAYWIVPDCTVREQLVRAEHITYLEENGGHRPGHKHESLHMSIREKDLRGWEDKWDVLGLNLDVM